MPDMSKEQLEARKKIEVRGLRGNVNAEFLHEIFKAFKEGYEPLPIDKMWRKDSPVFKGNRKTVYLYPKGFSTDSSTEVIAKAALDKEPVPDVQDDVVDEAIVPAPEVIVAPEDIIPDESEVKEDLVATIEALTTKKDLLDKAKELGISVPEDKKVPKAIKQYMLNTLKEE